MNIYSRKSRWKLYLAIGGCLIVLLSTLYTSYLAKGIAYEEETKVANYLNAVTEVGKPLDEDCEDCMDYTFYTNIISSNKTIPVIIIDDRGNIDSQYAINFPKSDSASLAKELKRLVESGLEPIEINNGAKAYYKESTLLTQLKYFPLIQLSLIAAFILMGYLAFSSARRAQENQVWVGLAKETAHQLGTPTSAIMGWVDYIKMTRPDDPEMMDVANSLAEDVERLDTVSQRFSKIGAAPELEPNNIFDQLEKHRAYMSTRSPRKVTFDFPEVSRANHLLVHINPQLFDWVLENLLRNALDAMGREGKISAEVYEDNDYVYIDVSDTGKGIPTGKFKTVFKPGFSTKKRGWGLGLSLTKRIIEEYHNGKIFVKKSEENVGTTFTIQLPKHP